MSEVLADTLFPLRGRKLKAMTNFKCPGSYSEWIPPELLSNTEYRFPQAHTDMTILAGLSQEIKNLKNDSVCKLPFCLTVEAEAMGADINLDDKKHGPRVRQYAFSQIEEIENIAKINFHQGRIKAVLDSVEHLTRQNETVALNIEGPFTILSSLVEPKIIYSAIRKKNESIVPGLERIEENIVDYALQGLQKGAKILSYADPVGGIDMIGPKMYQQHSGRVTYSILKKLTDTPRPAVIHLCGKSSTALEKTGFSLSFPMDRDENQTYKEAFFNLINDSKQTRIIGHSCFHQIAWKKRAPKIWEIRLNSPDKNSASK